MRIFTDTEYPPVVKKNGAAAQRPVKWSMAGCANLRRDDDEPEILRPAGKPHCLAQVSVRPKISFECRRTQMRIITLWLSGLSLSYSVSPGGVDIYSAVRRPLGELPAEPVEFIHDGKVTVKVLLKGAPAVYVDYDDSTQTCSMAVEMPPLPEVGIGVTDVQMMRLQVRGGRLSGESDGRSAGSLAAADNSLLVSRAMDAYSELKAQGAAQGRFVQPVLARWRVVDASGATLMRGPWVYPSALQGMQCTGGVSMASADSLASVSDGVLQAQTYRLRLTGELPVLPEPWCSVAAKMVVEVTAEADPVDPDGAVSQGYVDVDPQGVTSARVYLPGCSPEGAAHRWLYRSRIVDELRRWPATCRVVGVIERPFAAGAELLSSISAHTADAAVTPDSGGESYTYTSAVRAGNALFLGNPARQGAPAVPGGCFDIGGGRYSPLVTAAAGAMEFASGMRILSLTPMKEASLAYSLTDDLSPHVEAPQVAAVAPGAPEWGTVHFVDTAAPGAPPVVSVAGTDEIVAMAQPPRGGSSWDFARVKLLLFGCAGIRVATFDAGGRLRSSAPFDPRGVPSARCVCAGVAPSGGGCLYVVAGGDLLRVLPSRSETLLRRCDAVAIGWSGRYGELWLLSADGRLERMNQRGERFSVLADEFAGQTAVEFSSFGGESLMATADALYTLDWEDAPELVRCRLRLRAQAPGIARGAELHLFGSNVTGSVTLSGDNGSEVPEMLASVGLRGQVNAPVRVPLRVPYRRCLTLDADLRLPPDASLRWE